MTETVTTLEQWRAWRREGYNTLPLLRRVPLGPGEDRPAEWSGAWAAAHPHAILLESGKDGRYTYLGLRPSAVLRGKGSEAVASETGGAADHAMASNGGMAEVMPPTIGSAPIGGAVSGEANAPGSAAAGGAEFCRGASVRRFAGKPLDVLRAWIAGCHGPPLSDGPKWIGGIAGFLGYDIARSIERLPETAADDLGLPDYLFLRLDELWIIDHGARELILARHVRVPDGTDDGGLAVLHEEALRHTSRMREIWDGIAAAAGSPEALAQREGMRQILRLEPAGFDPETFGEIRLATPKEAFMEAVNRIRRYIAQGECVPGQPLAQAEPPAGGGRRNAVRMAAPDQPVPVHGVSPHAGLPAGVGFARAACPAGARAPRRPAPSPAHGLAGPRRRKTRASRRNFWATPRSGRSI